MSRVPPAESCAPTTAFWDRWRARVSLATILAASLGTLMLVAVGSVSVVTLGTAGRTTIDFLQDKANLTLTSIEQNIRQHLDPVVQQSAYLKDLIERSSQDGVDLERVATDLRAALAATPQVTGLVFLDAQSGRMVRVGRDGESVERGWTDIPELVQLAARARTGGDAGTGAMWHPPTWNPVLRQTAIPLTMPVGATGRDLGTLLAAVKTQQLSAYVAGLSTSDQSVFVLYGREQVLAHPGLAGGDPGSSAARPLPALATFGDAALASIWSPNRRRTALGDGFEGGGAHMVDRPDGSWLYIYRPLTAYGELAWTIGAAIPGQALGREFERLLRIALLTAALLLAAVLIAVLFGRRIAAPMMAVARVARSVQAFDLGSTPRLPRSRVREIDEAALALNSMVAALRWFEQYVPKRLVQQLLATGESVSPVAVERHLTVMFTDIRGFSRLCSQMSAAETAAFLNAHIALVGAAIERSGGTIDKYIGDSVMAFWGAPEPQPDHAERACAAAREIASSMRDDNAGRLQAGLEPICVRLGIATGDALVGNIGVPGRLNYTLVGDVVNVAQRLEQLGKQIDGECDVIALYAEVGERRATVPAGAVDVGSQTLRDRDGEIEVFRLI